MDYQAFTNEVSVMHEAGLLIAFAKVFSMTTKIGMAACIKCHDANLVSL